MKVGFVFHWLDSNGEISNVTQKTACTLEELQFIANDLDNLSRVHVYPVNRSEATPAPIDFFPFGRTLWCPYCAAEREFTRDAELEIERCEICTISVSDYYVRRENGMIPSGKEKEKRRDNSRGMRQQRENDAGEEAE